MSLISIRNLSAPLRSKVQIGAIVIIGLLVTVLRALGGSSYSRSEPAARSTSEERQSASAAVDANNRAIADFLNNQERRDARRQAQRDPALDDLSNGNFEREHRKQRNQAEKSTEFDDIKRSLGME